tara:strand:- start:5679 stop:5825 length:147 start_codon:yes stop_codon:yes gene_type:complete
LFPTILFFRKIIDAKIKPFIKVMGHVTIERITKGKKKLEIVLQIKFHK